jgi:hypothetical protein
MKPTLNDLRTLPDFAPKYRWDVRFVTFPTITPISVGFALPDPNRLNIQCISSDVPKRSGKSFDVTIRGFTVLSPGIWTVSGTIKLTLIETVDNVVLNYLENWAEATWAMLTGVSQSKVDCSAHVILTRMDRSDLPVRRYDIQRAFLQEYDPGADLDEKSDTINPTMTLAYDSFIESDIRGA